MIEHLNDIGKQYQADEVITLQEQERKKVQKIIFLTIIIILLLLIIFSYIIIKYTYLDERMVYLFYLTTKDGCLMFK